jgi:signal recognition particle receptor subunit beta
MRIGEIAVIGTGVDHKKRFVKSVCDEIVVETQSLIFGRMAVNDELVVHLYGLDFWTQDTNLSWDLVAKKLLGYVALFTWNNRDSYAKLKSSIDALSDLYRIPVVVAAILQNGQPPIPHELLDVDFNLAEQEQFTFCDISQPDSIKHVLSTLVDSIIQNYS